MRESMGKIRKATLVVAGLAAIWATPASAQTASDTKTYVGAVVGVQSVQNVGGLAGVEFGYHASDRLDVRAEATWLQDTVTRRRIGTAETVGSFLQQSQGGTVVTSLEAPALLASGGVRYVFGGERSVRPYVLAGVGIARVTLVPKYTLNSKDVTEQLSQYGISLGSDLTGVASKPAITGGVGVATSRGDWKISADLRVTSIRMLDQPSNVLRLNVGIGRDF